MHHRVCDGHFKKVVRYTKKSQHFLILILYKYLIKNMCIWHATTRIQENHNDLPRDNSGIAYLNYFKNIDPTQNTHLTCFHVEKIKYKV